MPDTDQRLAALEARLTQLEDIEAVRKLQFLYGYLIDQCMYDEVVDLFADDGEVRFFGGRFIGKAGVRRLYVGRFRKTFTGDVNGPVDGFLLDHPQLQDVIDIQADGHTALARVRALMQAGRHADHGGPRQWWEGGLYENTYVKEGGVWKIKVLDYKPQWHADFDKGWAHTPPNYVPFFTRTFAQGEPTGPDELIDAWLWPDRRVVPFHNPHPVTGKPMVPEGRG
ncbi:MAG TPA: nuclear transport factor 2 family protein [Phenylobacterium sp.]|nr:nuclear transport factor 2 family protein [Phenylobacterium sp.]